MVDKRREIGYVLVVSENTVKTQNVGFNSAIKSVVLVIMVKHNGNDECLASKIYPGGRGGLKTERRLGLVW